MTMQRLTIGVNRAARFLLAGNPKLIMTAANLQEAARFGKLSPLQLVEPSNDTSEKGPDDPVAVAIAMRAVVLRDERKARRPTAEQLRMRKCVMAAAFRHSCRMTA